MSIEDHVRRSILDRMGYIYGVDDPEGVTSAETMAEGFIEMLHDYGARICKKRGDHDYSDKVPQTTNMYLCFRCGEPGWEMP